MMHSHQPGAASARFQRTGPAGHLRIPALGFTLIELMIVVAIVGILAAVALPAYQSYIRRGQLQEAFTILSDFRIKMEQYYQDNKNYGSAFCGTSGTAGVTTASWTTTAGVITAGGAKYFGYTCLSTGQAYTFTATGSGSATTGYWYTINQDGLKTTTKYNGVAPSPAASCWLSNSTTC